MAIGFKRQWSRNLGNCRVALIHWMPVLPVVNRNTNRDATVGQDDLLRVAISVSP